MRVEEFMAWVKEKNPHQNEFHQAVAEFSEYTIPYINENPKYKKFKILERLVEPDRMISFRVNWVDDKGVIQINRGYRVQFNQTIGPYKGGLRFDESVNESILKFLGFEQIFKNSLTTLPIGGGKGGSDFSPKGKSNAEIMRFCYAYMSELFRHIGENTDVPAGDIGVGSREIGYLFGVYRKLTNKNVGVLTGRGIEYGGSLVRTEATGFGAIYFISEALKHISDSVEGKSVALSGSGNVAQYAAKKLVEYNAKVLTLSDRGGYIFFKEGATMAHVDEIIELKKRRDNTLEAYAKENNLEFIASKRPWEVPCDIALPCATQNELNLDDAKNLMANGCRMVAEAANMPTTKEAMDRLIDSGVIFLPAKATNAGGVAVSALEMAQSSMRYFMSYNDVDKELKSIMKKIHTNCVRYGRDSEGRLNYAKGANLAGFIKVANSMVAGGIV